jgi:hypothetical protein
MVYSLNFYRFKKSQGEKMKKIVLTLLLICSFSYAAEKGSMLSLSCASCHGTDGKSEAITPFQKTHLDVLLDLMKGFL